VEQKFIILNWKEGGILNILLIVFSYTFISFTLLTALCYSKLSPVPQTLSPLSHPLLSHPPLGPAHYTNVYTAPGYNGRSGELSAEENYKT